MSNWRCEECDADWHPDKGACWRCGNRTRIPAKLNVELTSIFESTLAGTFYSAWITHPNKQRVLDELVAAVTSSFKLVPVDRETEQSTEDVILATIDAEIVQWLQLNGGHDLTPNARYLRQDKELFELLQQNPQLQDKLDKLAQRHGYAGMMVFTK